MELLVLVVGLVLLAVLAMRFGHDSREGMPGNETLVPLNTGKSISPGARPTVANASVPRKLTSAQVKTT